jgi:CRISPR/Cas system CSM-associated protein Csm2 small subunit
MGLGPSGKAMTMSVVAAPAPGSMNSTNSIEGAGDGVGCLPSLDKAHAPGEWVRRFFCDVHRRAKNGEGYRISFTTDGVTFKHVDGFAEIPVRAGDKVFADVVPLQHTDGAVELLRRGVELYCLRRLTLIKERREELKLPKTTRGDIKALMSIEERWFRKLSEDFLIMRRMISAYRSLLRSRQQLENKCKALSEAEKHTLKPAIKALENQMDEMAKQIAEEAGRRYPAYNKLVEVLGIDGNLQAMEALAELMTYIDTNHSWTKIRNYLGLWKRDRKNRYHKSKTARQALERLTITIKGYGVKGRDLEEVLKTIWTTLRTQKTGPPA